MERRYTLQTAQGNMLQSLRAVQAFLDQNASLLGDIGKTGARQQLDAAVEQLSAHASDQSGLNLAAQAATKRHDTLRQVLIRDHMAPIARIARADLPPTPSIEPLRMPKVRLTSEKLAAYAAGMGKAAAPFASVFVAAGLPDDFIAQLDAAAEAMSAAVDQRMQSRGQRGGATQGLKAKLSRGRKIVHVLDSFVQKALQDNQSLLTNWNIVKRVQRSAPGPVPFAAPAPAPVPLPAPAPTPAPATESTGS